MRASLISTMGMSPGVVTSAMDCLLKEDIHVDRVGIITTSHDAILKTGIPLIEREFERAGVPLKLYIVEKDDITCEEDVWEMMFQVKKAFSEVDGMKYVSIAGGRKAMVSVVATMAQLFGPSKLVHVVSGIAETRGRIDSLIGASESTIREVLHPPDAKLVEIPILSYPIEWRERAAEILKLATESSTPVNELTTSLEEGGYLDRGRITPKGRNLLSLLE
jgi:hypothetical protein